MKPYCEKTADGKYSLQGISLSGINILERLLTDCSSQMKNTPCAEKQPVLFEISELLTAIQNKDE